MKLVLASNSPRRKELLNKMGYQFEVKVSDYEEKVFSLDPIKIATTFALGKAKSVFNLLENKDDVLVLGADTIVYYNGEILGKPNGDIEAFNMLKKLSGKEHKVITGFCLINTDKIITDYDTSNVLFNTLTDQEIDAYIKSGLYKGKAGAYGIQDKGFNLVKSYFGSLNNVIGLPTEKLDEYLKTLL